MHEHVQNQHFQHIDAFTKHRQTKAPVADGATYCPLCGLSIARTLSSQGGAVQYVHDWLSSVMVDCETTF